jgi:hypothetical protein
MPSSFTFADVSIWNISRSILVCLLLLNGSINAQQTPFSAAKWLDLAKKIDQHKGLSIVQLENEQFLEHALDGGGELTGYFHDGDLRKIHCELGYSYGIDEKTFYLDHGEVVFVRHISRRFAVDPTTGEVRHDSLEAPLTGSYYLAGGKLLHYVITETGHHFESEREDIENDIIQQSKQWIEALKRVSQK